MTTTLRPDEPEQRGAAGARSRRYAICVNSRPVGRIRLGTDACVGEEVGRIVSLEVDEPDRRRGRGTVAALAAEEVLRGWGCRRVEVAVPAAAGIALRMATALGYTERNRGMAKTLSGPLPELPLGSALRPIGEAEYPAWHARERLTCIRSRLDRGFTPEQAEATADADYRAVLPDGPATEGTALRILAHDGLDVGWVWVRIRSAADPEAPAWVFNVEVEEAHRGRGHGRTLMLAAERECRTAGVRELGLNVYSENPAARRLYESLGYQTRSHHLVKQLL